jgi:hypothetical protein
MMSKPTNYNPSTPSDVRKFQQEIARLRSTGPAGEVQAKRLLEQTAKTQSGKELIKKARKHAKIAAHAFKSDLSNIKPHVSSSGKKSAQSIRAQAFTKGQAAFEIGAGFSPASKNDLELIGHELAHVVQQSKKK